MTKLKPLLVGLVGAGVLAASGYSLYTVVPGIWAWLLPPARQQEQPQREALRTAQSLEALPKAKTPPAAISKRHQGRRCGPTTGRKILYYHDPLVAGQQVR